MGESKRLQPGIPSPRGVVSSWKRRSRHHWQQLTRDSLDRFCEEVSTTEYTLIVRCGYQWHPRHFPNAFVVESRESPSVNLPADPDFRELALIGPESFETVVCAGVLERVPDPARVIAELHRVLAPRGRMILIATAEPDTQTTADRLRSFDSSRISELCRGFTRIELLRTSTPRFGAVIRALRAVARLLPRPAEGFEAPVEATRAAVHAVVVK